MHKISIFVLSTAYLAICQMATIRNDYSVFDDYFGGSLFINDSIQTISQKVNYPGLIQDKDQTIAIGFLSHPVIWTTNTLDTDFSNSTDFSNTYTSLSWSDLYGWAEHNTKIGKIGGWIGNISLHDEENKKDENNSDLTQYGTGRIALWYNPAYKIPLKGISVEINQNYSLSKEDTFTSSNNYSYTTTSSRTEDQCFGADVKTLWSLNDNLFLKARVLGNYCKYENESKYFSYYNYYYNPYYYTPSISSSSSIYDSKFRQFGVSLGIVKYQGLSLLATVVATTDNSEAAFSSSTYTPTNSGFLGTFLEFAKSKTFSYMRHSLNLGVDIAAKFTFPTESSSHIDFGDVFKDSEKDNRVINCIVKFPVTVDINLFGSRIYTMIRVIPQLEAEDSKYKSTIQNKSEDRSASLSVDEIALGLRGTIGDRLEFSMVPSIKSNVFMSGLEIRYSIPAPKK